MTDTDHAALAAQLQAYILEHIPLARTMELRVARYDGAELELAAPLAPNINDKGCAFGGSLVSLMTLSGWGLVELELRRRGFDCDVFVAESTVHYLAPVWADFRSEARLAHGASWDAFFHTLRTRGRARVEVACHVPGDAPDKPAATLSARFVAKRRD